MATNTSRRREEDFIASIISHLHSGTSRKCKQSIAARNPGKVTLLLLLQMIEVMPVASRTADSLVNKKSVSTSAHWPRRERFLNTVPEPRRNGNSDLGSGRRGDLVFGSCENELFFDALCCRTRSGSQLWQNASPKTSSPR